MICFLLHSSPHKPVPLVLPTSLCLSYLWTFFLHPNSLTFLFYILCIFFFHIDLSVFSLLLFLVLILLLIHECTHICAHTAHTWYEGKLHLAYFASYNIRSTFIHSPANVTNQFFFIAERNFMYHILFIHLAVDGHQGLISSLRCCEWFIDKHKCARTSPLNDDLESFRYIPHSGISELYYS